MIMIILLVFSSSSSISLSVEPHLMIASFDTLIISLDSSESERDSSFHVIKVFSFLIAWRWIYSIANICSFFSLFQPRYVSDRRTQISERIQYLKNDIINFSTILSCGFLVIIFFKKLRKANITSSSLQIISINLS